jgi:lysozyme
MLAADLHLFEAVVEHGVKVALSQDEFDALVSLCYNIGPRAFLGSTVLKRLNADDRTGAANAMLMWDKAHHHVMAGLHHRREEERAEFLGGRGDAA